MDDVLATEVEKLVDEIGRYLAAVDAFRAANCEPKWLRELAPCRTPDECASARAEPASRAH